MSDRPRFVKPPEELLQDRRRLKGRRAIAGLGLREAATTAGVSSGHLSDMEKGYKSAGPKALVKLAGAYGCTVADLIPPEAGGSDDDQQESEAA